MLNKRMWIKIYDLTLGIYLIHSMKSNFGLDLLHFCRKSILFAVKRKRWKLSFKLQMTSALCFKKKVGSFAFVFQSRPWITNLNGNERKLQTKLFPYEKKMVVFIEVAYNSSLTWQGHRGNESHRIISLLHPLHL